MVGVGGGPVLLDGVTETVTAADPARLDGAVAVRTTAGSLAGLGDDGIAVGATRAGNEHWSVGTPVTMTLADGAVVPLTVRADLRRQPAPRAAPREPTACGRPTRRSRRSAPCSSR